MIHNQWTHLNYYCVTSTNQQIVTTLTTGVSQFATLNVGNISHLTFKIGTLYFVKSRRFVKTNTHCQALN